MLKVMERMIERLAKNDRLVIREQNEPQFRNPNFRQRRQQGLPLGHILQRGQRNQIRIKLIKLSLLFRKIC